jgi:hypothetical protein
MIRRYVAVVPLLFLFASCTKVPAPPAIQSAHGAVVGVPEAVYPANLFAVLKAGESPLWFELGENGPRLIDYPEAAELSPFIPWPLARHIRGMLACGKDLVAGVNREGLLLMRPWVGNGKGEEGLALYRIADAPNWEPYTLGSLFFYGETPAALVYRDDRFSEPAAPAPSPVVRALKGDLTGFEGLGLPCLGIIPFAEGWEADALRLGGDGLWYYRGILRRPDGRDIRYYRTPDLGQEGAEISRGAFRNSAQPEGQNAAPPLLWQVLEKAAALGGSDVSVLSPDFAGPRNFAPEGSPAGFAENGTPLFGFYRAGGPDLRAAMALAFFPDGRGLIGTAADDGTAAIREYALPPLPEDFVYTGIGLAGGAVFAAWEEQREWNIGAAGFMVVNLSD